MKKFFYLLPLLLSTCTSAEFIKHGKVSLHNTADKNSFVFSVDEEFGRIYRDSPQDKKNPKLTKAETTLLTALLTQKKYCLDGRSPKFSITSVQEKIYDVTYAHLIQENYNAKPVAPKMFFGNCVK